VIRRFVTGALIGALLAGTASADTLREALVSAYHTNPDLTGQREALKATDATVAIARAAGRPQISASAGVNKNISRSGVLALSGAGDETISVQGNVDVPLYTGGRVKNSVRAAKTRVEAGRATLTAVEGDVFTRAVAAYMDVIRDRAIVELNQNNVRVLETNLQATRDRFQIGDLTRTDVAQSEARLEVGRSQLSQSQGQLTASEATYRQVIGFPPGQLAPPPPLPPLPGSEDEAVRIAIASNPDLLSVERQVVAAGYDVRVAQAGRLPTISAVGTANYVNEPGGNNGGGGGSNGFPTAGSETAVGLSAQIPIFQGGLPAARTRQAQALQGQLQEQLVGTERAVIQTTRSAFAAYEAALQSIQAQTVAVQSNELALEGTRAEQSVGTRTVLDVLNAEQELLNSQVALVSAKRDAYVAGFQLLNAMGQAQARYLGLDGGPLYDPLGNYRRVAGNWNDWASDPRHPTIATRTVSPPEMPPTPIVTPADGNPRIEPTPPGPSRVTPQPAARKPISSQLVPPGVVQTNKVAAKVLSEDRSVTGVTQPPR
jgi:outer membrane protein